MELSRNNFQCDSQGAKLLERCYGSRNQSTSEVNCDTKNWLTGSEMSCAPCLLALAMSSVARRTLSALLAVTASCIRARRNSNNKHLTSRTNLSHVPHDRPTKASSSIMTYIAVSTISIWYAMMISHFIYYLSSVQFTGSQKRVGPGKGITPSPPKFFFRK